MVEITLDSKLTHTVVESHRNHHCWNVARSVPTTLCLQSELLLMGDSLASMQSFGLGSEKIILRFDLIIVSMSSIIDSC